MRQNVGIALLVAALAVSMGSWANPGWTDYATVAELMPTSQQSYLLRLTTKENPSGCKNKDTYYQDYATRGSDQMFRTLLEAVTSGKQVRVYVTGSCELNGYSEFSSVGIVP